MHDPRSFGCLCLSLILGLAGTACSDGDSGADSDSTSDTGSGGTSSPGDDGGTSGGPDDGDTSGSGDGGTSGDDAGTSSTGVTSATGTSDTGPTGSTSATGTSDTGPTGSTSATATTTRTTDTGTTTGTGATASYCTPEGESHGVYPGAPDCCPGLDSVGCEVPNAGNACPPCAGATFCTACGDGQCGPGENLCRCPEDCT